MNYNLIKNKIWICQFCGKKFTSKKACKSRIPKYCSQFCCGNAFKQWKICKICGKKFNKYQNKFFCSRKCAGIDRKSHIMSEKSRIKMSLAKKNKFQPQLNTPEIREKIRKALTGKPQFWNRGKNHPILNRH